MDRAPRHSAMVDFHQHCERLSVVLSEDCEKVEKERNQLLAFALEVMRGANDGDTFDTCDIQDLAVKHGLMTIEEREEPCEEGCSCAEYGFPTQCYRIKPELLGAEPTVEMKS